MTMPNRAKSRWTVIALLLLVLAVALVACGSDEEEEQKLSTPLLPRLTVSVNEEGAPKVLGIPLDKLGGLLGQDMSSYYLPQDLVVQLMDSDIQHAEVVLTKDGVFLFGNGEALPYLAADEESLNNLTDLVEEMQVPNSGAISWVVDNVIPRVGLPVVVKFPVGDGSEEIPLRDADILVPVIIEDARSGVTDRSIIAYLDVQFDENGTPTIAGAPLDEFEAALNEAGLSVDMSGAKLDPAMIAAMTNANIQHLQVETEPEGMYLYLNGKPLPRVAWDEERLDNAIDLYSQWDPDSPYLPALTFLAPYMQPADVELTLIFPVQGGAAETPYPFIRVE